MVYLDRSLTVDGMKTGYTSGAGCCLASSATQVWNETYRGGYGRI